MAHGVVLSIVCRGFLGSRGPASPHNLAWCGRLASCLGYGKGSKRQGAIVSQIGVEGVFWVIKTQRDKENAMRSFDEVVPSTEAPMAMQIKPFKPTKTEKQRAYLWGWVYAQTALLCEEAGIAFPLVGDFERPATKEILHAMGQEAFLVCGQIKKKNGQLVNIYTSTESLNRHDYWKYTENFTRLIYQCWGIVIPIPPKGSYYEQLAKEFSRGNP